MVRVRVRVKLAFKLTASCNPWTSFVLGTSALYTWTHSCTSTAYCVLASLKSLLTTNSLVTGLTHGQADLDATLGSVKNTGQRYTIPECFATVATVAFGHLLHRCCPSIVSGSPRLAHASSGGLHCGGELKLWLSEFQAPPRVFFHRFCHRTSIILRAD